MSNRITEESFLKDVANHQLTVIRDDGVNRHIRLSRPNTGCMRFDLVTWPGYLCFCGDMGTFVFSRVEDMFEFFRPDHFGLKVNPGYWSEKVQAADRTTAHDSDGITEYSADKFREAIAEVVEEYLENVRDGQSIADDLRERVADDVLRYADEGQHEAVRAAMDFEYNGQHLFHDFWETRVREYTYRFIWCCYAVVWGIDQYDKAKEQAA